MRFKMRAGRGFSDTQTIYEGEVVGRKLNGYLVKMDDETALVRPEDVEVISITAEEKASKIIW